jgi:FlaA1/EpsC-like NDP-sugar epimerase
MNILNLIGRTTRLFDADLAAHEAQLSDIVRRSRVLVIGGAGSIGQAVVRELFRRKPRALHVVDISENNLVELVRDIRSSLGYIEGDFRTFAIDVGGREFEALMAESHDYDHVFNLSALKHVRSERDPFTLMRLIDVNITNSLKTLSLVRNRGAGHYFCVSSDKAANPASLMGASKRLMEMFMIRQSRISPVSMARFPNVAFSDGSLLYGFTQRFQKRQPMSSPSDVWRYFITPQESGELCLMAGLLGENRDILFPKLTGKLPLVKCSDIAVRYLEAMGFEPVICDTEDEARARVDELTSQRRWPCHFFASDTAGEKPIEEFFTAAESPDMDRFLDIGVIRNADDADTAGLDTFPQELAACVAHGPWRRERIAELFTRLIPEFRHLDRGRFLDDRL